MIIIVLKWIRRASTDWECEKWSLVSSSSSRMMVWYASMPVISSSSIVESSPSTVNNFHLKCLWRFLFLSNFYVPPVLPSFHMPQCFYVQNPLSHLQLNCPSPVRIGKHFGPFLLLVSRLLWLIIECTPNGAAFKRPTLFDRRNAIWVRLNHRCEREVKSEKNGR